MRRVLVIGCGGAGKSTFATRLAALTGLPLIHLDALYWQRGWIEPPKELWTQTVERLAAAEQWIMDGNYGGTLEMRLAKCDTVILLDLPRRLCLWRVVLRRIRFHGRARPDMTQGCDEQLSWTFLLWIWSYRKERRPKILQLLEALRPDQQAVVLRTDAEIEAFSHSVERNPADVPIQNRRVEHQTVGQGRGTGCDRISSGTPDGKTTRTDDFQR